MNPSTTPAPVAAATRGQHGHAVLACPPLTMPLWSQHPRVYLDPGHDGQARCPYCGTVYRLNTGEPAGGGH